MSARIILGAAGSYAFGPIGGAVGQIIGGAIDGPTKLPTQYNNPPQQDLRVMGTEYGQIIPYIRGAKRVAPLIVWNSDFSYDETTTTETTGGKGGGEPEQTTVTVTRVYKINLLLMFARNVGVGIAKIWNNGDLIYNASSDADTATQTASSEAEFCTRMTFYSGADGQEPDPVYALAVGDENAPAYIGRSTLFLHEFKTGESATMPNLTFEFVADGTITSTISPIVAATSLPMDNNTHSGYSNGYFYMMESFLNYLSTDALQRTADGVTWERCGPTNPGARGLCFCAGTFGGQPRLVMQTNDAVIWTSDDGGDTWISRGAVTSFGQIRCFNEKWLATRTGGTVYWSNDGAAWTAAAVPSVQTWRDAVYLSSVDKWFLLNNTNSGAQIAVSDDDRLTWTAVATPTSPVATYNAWFMTTDDENRILCSNVNDDHTLCSTDAGATFVDLQESTYQFGSGECIYQNGKWVIYSGAGAPNTVMYSEDNWATWTTLAHPSGSFERGIKYGGGKLWFTGDDSPWCATGDLSVMDLITKASVPVNELQRDLMLLGGYTAGQIDVTELTSITNEVDSFSWSEASGIRAPSEMLMRNYHYEAVMSGTKILFRPRAGASVATIPYADLGVTLAADDPEPFEINLGNDVEIPARKGLQYVNLSFDYQPDFIEGDRLISTMESSVDMDSTTLGFTPARAKAISDARSLDAYIARVTSAISLQTKWAELEPTDVITVTASDGSTFRMRVRSMTDEFPKFALELVLDDSSVFSQEGIASADYDAPTTLASKPDTDMVLFDPPLLRDTEDSPSIYVATRGSSTPYPGAAIFKSTDSFVTYSLEATVDESAVLGFTTSALSSWTGPRVFDERSKVRVNVGTAGVITSTTRAAMLADPYLNAFMIGNEVVRVRDADLVSAGVYDLSGFLRGRLGTEWAMTGHASGEDVVMLRSAGLRRMLLQNNQLGVSQSYRGVTRGRAVSTAATENITPMARNLMPRAPKRVRVRRNTSGDITFEVMRRTRFSTRRGSVLGSSVPLGENEERYELDLFTVGSPQGAAITLTIEFTNTLTYTAAEQVADFGQVMTYGTLVVQAYQISNAVGRGYRLEATA